MNRTLSNYFAPRCLESVVGIEDIAVSLQLMDASAVMADSNADKLGK